MLGLHAVFFLSGFAALVYQVVWQRSLFALYGINSESVTVIVSAFMIGLGVGSLAGGALSRTRIRPVVAFGAAELGIAAFGLSSLGLFHRVGEATLLWSPPAVAGVTFLLLLVPTLLMGATLPLLTAHVVRVRGNVGRAVGSLYFANTLGSAAAAVVTAFLFLALLGQSGSVRLAAALNAIVGVGALALSTRQGVRP